MTPTNASPLTAEELERLWFSLRGFDIPEAWLNRLEATVSTLTRQNQELQAQVEAAEAESARLREALPTLEQWERFVEGFLDTTPDGFTDSEMAKAIVARIDRALST
jgi:multidrug resistance efflux pump